MVSVGNTISCGSRQKSESRTWQWFVTRIAILTIVGCFAPAKALQAANAQAFSPAQRSSEPLAPLTPAQSPPLAASSSPAKGEVPAKVLDAQEVEGVLGKDVRSTAGENMGRIVDVIVNRAGEVRAAIIDFGGFLGVGSRKIAIDWRALQFASDGKLDRVLLSLTRNDVRVAPEYRPGEQVVILGPMPSATTDPATGPPASPEKPAAE